ncbi:hypothetical protein ABZS66_10035 [Dactylosporangium sp. NPDC005572]|uniref:hypothetical protein n=1 Tax=Dactylosporangium sp. NPDC005572 TaxID=3156889 RepID=UPI0033BA53E7
MRRLIILLAVPALALSFFFAPSGTREAKALDPGFGMQIYCSLWVYRLLQAEAANDWVTYEQLWAQSSQYCSD